MARVLLLIGGGIRLEKVTQHVVNTVADGADGELGEAVGVRKDIVVYKSTTGGFAFMLDGIEQRLLIAINVQPIYFSGGKSESKICLISFSFITLSIPSLTTVKVSVSKALIMPVIFLPWCLSGTMATVWSGGMVASGTTGVSAPTAMTSGVPSFTSMFFPLPKRASGPAIRASVTALYERPALDKSASANAMCVV